jgi:integrase
MATIAKYQTKAGAKYRVRYRTPEGRQTDKRGFDTKRDADAFAATVEVAKMKGAYVAPKLGKVTVGDLGPAWLQRQRGILKPSTFRIYDGLWNVHVSPRWGATGIGKIRRTDVQAWISELAGRRSASLVTDTYGVLARILDDAVVDNMLAVNPARGVKLPPRPPQHNTYLTMEQLHALAEESGERGSLVLLLGVGGCRWGESAVLRVCDVDFLRRRMHLHRNAVKVGKQGMVVGTLKGNKNRTVALSPFVIEAVSKTAEDKGRDDLLWPSQDGGFSPPPGHDSWLSGAVGRCMEADPTFPRVTAHDLRHTAASLAISSGANPLVVQRMLGHKSAAMTLDVYSDLFDSDMSSVAENVGKMWAQAIEATKRSTEKSL